MHRRQSMAATAAASLSTSAIGAAPVKPVGAKRPVIVASRNGLRAVEKAMELVKQGHDPLDAAIEAVAIVEGDPRDHSLGLGGLPNGDGVVELDAAVTHGPRHGEGSVAAIQSFFIRRRRRRCSCRAPGSASWSERSSEITSPPSSETNGRSVTTDTESLGNRRLPLPTRTLHPPG
jgi:Asparaginase